MSDIVEPGLSDLVREWALLLEPLDEYDRTIRLVDMTETFVSAGLMDREGANQQTTGLLASFLRLKIAEGTLHD